MRTARWRACPVEPRLLPRQLGQADLDHARPHEGRRGEREKPEVVARPRRPPHPGCADRARDQHFVACVSLPSALASGPDEFLHLRHVLVLGDEAVEPGERNGAAGGRMHRQLTPDEIESLNPLAPFVDLGRCGRRARRCSIPLLADIAVARPSTCTPRFAASNPASVRWLFSTGVHQRDEILGGNRARRRRGCFPPMSMLKLIQPASARAASFCAFMGEQHAADNRDGR